MLRIFICITYMQMNTVREETARLELAIKLRSKESDQLSNSTKECRRSLAEREESRRALADVSLLFSVS